MRNGIQITQYFDKMGNKEKLASEYAERNSTGCIDKIVRELAFISGWDARQPEVDKLIEALRSISNSSIGIDEFISNREIVLEMLEEYENG